MKRVNNRASDALRSVKIHRGYVKHAEGSALIELGDTHVLCTASVLAGVPKFLRERSEGWLTAEYSLLPRATHTRNDREATKGRQSGRTLEIQRLIGRSLRAVVDLKQLADYTIAIDCDVLQADGGTRTAAITGAYVALVDAVKFLEKKLKPINPILRQAVAAVSVGIVGGEVVLDLDYCEDSNADTDMNVVMTADGRFVEIQGTAEKRCFDLEQLNCMLAVATSGLQQLLQEQNRVFVDVA